MVKNGYWKNKGWGLTFSLFGFMPNISKFLGKIFGTKKIFTQKKKKKKIKTVSIAEKCEVCSHGQGIIQKKSVSGSRTLPCVVIFFRNFILI